MPAIPKGFATKLGTAGAALLAVVAAVTPFLDGDHTGDTRFFAALSTALAAVTILGRMLQAAAQLLRANSVLDGGTDDPDLWSDDDEPVAARRAPSEQDLKADFPDDAPELRPSGQGKAGEA